MRHIRLMIFRCRPATSALSALSLVAYLARVFQSGLLQCRPKSCLLDKSLFAHCLFHLYHLLPRTSRHAQAPRARMVLIYRISHL